MFSRKSQVNLKQGDVDLRLMLMGRLWNFTFQEMISKLILSSRKSIYYLTQNKYAPILEKNQSTANDLQNQLSSENFSKEVFLIYF